MYLSRVYIRNYRSIKMLDLPFSTGKTVIVGRNNAGKSNIVKAIDLVLGEASPTWAKSEAISPDDFFSWRESESGLEVTKSASEMFIWCELRREDGENLNFAEINQCFGFSVRTQPGGRPRIPLRVAADQLPENHALIFAENPDDLGRDEKEWVDAKLTNQRRFEQELGDKYHFAFAFRATKDDSGEIVKELRFLYREDEHQSWVLAFKASIRPELLQSAIVPSFRDPAVQLRLAPWTWYGKLMRHLTAKYEGDDGLRQAFESVKAASGRVFAQVQADLDQSALQVAFPGTTMSIHLGTTDRDNLYKNCAIYIDDGFTSPLTEKGAGIQSATIIGLFNYYTRRVNTVTSALLCIEEPEIYLHPHARRVLSDRLDEFLDNGRNQVILTTHSSEFIRTNDGALDVILVRRDEAGTRAKELNLRQYRGLLVDNNKNELFFADKVIACEGYDEYVVRAVADALFPHKLDEQNVSVISVQGKDRLRQLVGMTVSLGIRCFILADFDYLLRDQSDDRKKYGDVKAHESLAELGAAAFTQRCTFGNIGNAVLQRLRTRRAAVKLADERGFYTAKRISELNYPKQAELVAALAFLRAHGMCVLSGQIEDLVKEKRLLSQGKFTLDGVFELGRRLAEGEKATDLFETAELEQLLRAVLELPKTPTPQPRTSASATFPADGQPMGLALVTQPVMPAPPPARLDTPAAQERRPAALEGEANGG